MSHYRINRRRFLQASAAALPALIAACGGAGTSTPTAPQAKPAITPTAAPHVSGPSGASVTLTVLTHWGDQSLLKALTPWFEECARKVNVRIVHQTVAFDQLLTKIMTGRLGGQSVDIYHFYNLWLPDFVGSDLLAPPPVDLVDDIKSNYSQGSVEGVTYNGQIWGYPTEVDSYQLIYNKKIFNQAGIDDVPKTWDDVRTAAKRCTKKDSSGKITQAGFMLIKGWDSGVVHPWLSLLWSNGGEFVSKDYSQALFNQQPGVQTLDFEMDLINDGSVNLGFGLEDFVAGKAAMTIMANWWGSSLRASSLGIKSFGSAPIPYNDSHESVALQYNWLWGVDKNSPHADIAWKFIECLNSPRNGKASPMGEYLTTGLNALPSRLSDQKALASRINDPFIKPFVEALSNARTEPIIPGAQEIKTSLQKQIEAAWYKQKSPKEALDTAAQEAERILKEKRQ